MPTVSRLVWEKERREKQVIFEGRDTCRFWGRHGTGHSNGRPCIYSASFRVLLGSHHRSPTLSWASPLRLFSPASVHSWHQCACVRISFCFSSTCVVSLRPCHCVSNLAPVSHCEKLTLHVVPVSSISLSPYGLSTDSWLIFLA